MAPPRIAIAKITIISHQYHARPAAGAGAGAGDGAGDGAGTGVGAGDLY